MNIKITEAIGTADHKFSGRDVKNLLKLAILTSKGKGVILAEHVAFATQFHPTLEKAC